MKLNCLSCGHSIDLDEAYGNYQGNIKCFVCGAMLEVRIEDECIKSAKLPRLAERRQRRFVHAGAL